jgi:hypothetical protein
LELAQSTTNYFESGARGGAVVEALSYKPEGRGIDSKIAGSLPTEAVGFFIMEKIHGTQSFVKYQNDP